VSAPEGRVRRLIAFYFNGVFAKFLVAGGLAAAANFASRLALQPLTGFDLAVVLAYLMGFLTAFVLNRIFVFPKSGKPMRVEMAWFFLFNLIAFPVVVVSAVLLRDHLFSRFLPAALAETVAHGCAILIPVVFNFAAHRLVTFGGTRTAPP
jgi:putative flippase GtrA